MPKNNNAKGRTTPLISHRLNLFFSRELYENGEISDSPQLWQALTFTLVTISAATAALFWMFSIAELYEVKGFRGWNVSVPFGVYTALMAVHIILIFVLILLFAWINKGFTVMWDSGIVLHNADGAVMADVDRGLLIAYSRYIITGIMFYGTLVAMWGALAAVSGTWSYDEPFDPAKFTIGSTIEDLKVHVAEAIWFAANTVASIIITLFMVYLYIDLLHNLNHIVGKGEHTHKQLNPEEQTDVAGLISNKSSKKKNVNYVK